MGAIVYPASLRLFAVFGHPAKGLGRPLRGLGLPPLGHRGRQLLGIRRDLGLTLRGLRDLPRGLDQGLLTQGKLEHACANMVKNLSEFSPPNSRR